MESGYEAAKLRKRLIKTELYEDGGSDALIFLDSLYIVRSLSDACRQREARLAMANENTMFIITAFVFYRMTISCVRK